jgi:hypothetical protein
MADIASPFDDDAIIEHHGGMRPSTVLVVLAVVRHSDGNEHSGVKKPALRFRLWFGLRFEV